MLILNKLLYKLILACQLLHQLNYLSIRITQQLV